MYTGLYNQPHHVYVTTGRHAYQMLIPIHSNPFRNQPFRDLWDKGYRQERAKSEGYSRKATTKQTNAARPGPKYRQNPQDRNDRPLVSDRRVANFNRRNRTSL